MHKKIIILTLSLVCNVITNCDTWGQRQWDAYRPLLGKSEFTKDDLISLRHCKDLIEINIGQLNALKDSILSRFSPYIDTNDLPTHQFGQYKTGLKYITRNLKENFLPQRQIIVPKMQLLADAFNAIFLIAFYAYSPLLFPIGIYMAAKDWKHATYMLNLIDNSIEQDKEDLKMADDAIARATSP